MTVSYFAHQVIRRRNRAKLTKPELAADEGFQNTSNKQTEAVDVAPVEALVALLCALLARLEEVDELLEEKRRGVAVEAWFGQLRFEEEREILEN